MRLVRAIFTRDLYFLFSCPALLWQGLFLYLPIAILMLYSLLEYSPTTGDVVISFDCYRQIFNSVYFKVILNSCVIASSTAVLCLSVAYPVAFFLAMKVTKRWRTFFLVTLILPSWTSLIVQIYSWFFLLEKKGFLSRFLTSIGLISDSFHLLNNYFSILIGMVSCFLPFMILPIYATLEKMDKNLLEASADLGANRWETFKRVILPLSMPGVYAGLLLVFIPAFGEFAIPTLLGGAKTVFWGNLIVDKFLKSRDWRSGSALATIGVLLPTLMILIGYWGMRLWKRIQLAKLRNIQASNLYKDAW